MKIGFKHPRLGLIAAISGALVIAAPVAHADLIFSGTGFNMNNTPISATVDFSLIGNDFRIVLTNNNPALEQASVLTNLGVVVAPTPATALPSTSGKIALTTGSSFVGPAPGNTLGEEWAYLSGGAASSGFGVGTGHGNLCGSTVCNGDALDGSAYGLVGPGTDLSSNNGFNGRTYVNDSITIDITLAANSTFSLSNITSVDFQYGTSPNEGDIPVDGCTGGSDCSPGNGKGGSPVPEPASLAIFGTALVGLGLFGRRRRRRKEDAAV